MKKAFLAALAAVPALFGLAGPARTGCLDLPCGAPNVGWVDQVVTCYRTETRVRDVPCTVNRTVSHEETYEKKCWVNVPSWSEQKRTVWIYHEKPKEVERDVTCLLPLPPAPPCAPATVGCGGPGCDGGCGHGCGPSCDICNNAVPATYTEHVKCIEAEAAPEKFEFMEKVCTYKAVAHTELATRTVTQVIPETVIHHETYAVQVPYQVTIKVPVCGAAGCGCGH
jgi:hypothetical protein